MSRKHSYRKTFGLHPFSNINISIRKYCRGYFELTAGHTLDQSNLSLNGRILWAAKTSTSSPTIRNEISFSLIIFMPRETSIQTAYFWILFWGYGSWLSFKSLLFWKVVCNLLRYGRNSHSDGNEFIIYLFQSTYMPAHLTNMSLGS